MPTTTIWDGIWTGQNNIDDSVTPQLDGLGRIIGYDAHSTLPYEGQKFITADIAPPMGSITVDPFQRVTDGNWPNTAVLFPRFSSGQLFITFAPPSVTVDELEIGFDPRTNVATRPTYHWYVYLPFIEIDWWDATGKIAGSSGAFVPANWDMATIDPVLNDPPWGPPNFPLWNWRNTLPDGSITPIPGYQYEIDFGVVTPPPGAVAWQISFSASYPGVLIIDGSRPPYAWVYNPAQNVPTTITYELRLNVDGLTRGRAFGVVID